jgi:hypothetical protein
VQLKLKPRFQFPHLLQLQRLRAQLVRLLC